MKSTLLLRAAAALLCAVVPAFGQAANQAKQNLPISLGTSGGNVNDITKRYCCSGTLGALVTKNGVSYILSNNHVLGLSGSAVSGQDVSQPGLIDASCRVANTSLVADFSSAPSLGGATNVDAALAEVRSGAVRTDGNIIGVGVPSHNVGNPAVGMNVAKSGRTTGFTCSTISSTNTTISVQYQQSCGSGRKFTVQYRNQVVINSSTFSAGGDSGSLIVDRATARPVALLFAGSTSTTIGNPIGDVVNAFGGLNFVGGSDRAVSCAGAASTQGATAQALSASEHSRAEWAKNRAESLLDGDAIMGVGISSDENGRAVLVFYTETGRIHRDIPAEIDGVKTKVVRTDKIKAYGWNEALMPASCSSK